MVPMPKGRFITFEGIDGCGKSTQALRAAEYLGSRGIPFIHTREPGGTPIAEKIRALILDPAHTAMGDRCELLLYLAARAQHVGEKIIPALAAGTWVLCDRFADATRAYQGAGRGMDDALLHPLLSFAAHEVVPDLTFVFDIDTATAAERMAAAGRDADRMEKNPRDFHERVREGYRAIAAAEPNRVALIDAAQSPDRVFEAVRTLLNALI